MHTRKYRNTDVFASLNSSGISAVSKFIFPPSVVICITPMRICRKWPLLILIFTTNRIHIVKLTLILYNISWCLLFCSSPHKIWCRLSVLWEVFVLTCRSVAHFEQKKWFRIICSGNLGLLNLSFRI